MTTHDALAERVLSILGKVTGDATVVSDLDVPLFASGLVDSLGVVTLMLDFEEAFGVVISPADFDRERWATPREIVADVARRLRDGHTA